MNVVILTGAGMSAESGISTFRDNGGLWDQYNVEDVNLNGLNNGLYLIHYEKNGQRITKKVIR